MNIAKTLAASAVAGMLIGGTVACGGGNAATPDPNAPASGAGATGGKSSCSASGGAAAPASSGKSSCSASAAPAAAPKH